MSDNHPELRCSDSDRDRVAEELREHYADGRLTLEEFHERSDVAYAAKTFGDLAPLTSDLPARVPKPAEAKPEKRQVLDPDARKRLAAMWGPWLSVSVICFGIWLFTMLASGMDWIYPWPLWVAGPWGIMLLAGTLGGARSQQRHLEQRKRRLERRRGGCDDPHGRYRHREL